MKDQKEQEAPVEIKILFFIQDPRLIEMATIQLEKMGYKICFARTTIEAFAQIQSFKPNVILLSWNLKKINIKSLYTHFTEKLKSLVIVFSELNDPITIMKLNNSGMQNSLFPPLSGQGIHVRLQILLKKHKEEGGHIGKTDEIGFKPVGKDSLPQDTQWKQVHSHIKDDGNNALLWKGVSANSKDKTFFFESNLSPQHLFSDNQELKHAGNDLTFMETDKAGEKFFTDLHHAKSDHETQIIANIFDEPSINVHLSLLHKLVKEAMAKNMTLNGEAKSKVTDVTTVSLMPLNTNRFKGYLVVTHAKGKLDSASLSNVFVELKKMLEENGEKCSEQDVVVEVGFDKIHFGRWLEKRKADFFVRGALDSNEVIFVFLQREKYPLVVDVKDGHFVGVKVEEVLVENSKLTFDLYLHFPKNNKFIRYIKKRKIVTDKVLAKLTEFQVKEIYFSKEERGEFYQYLASTFLDFNL